MKVQNNSRRHSRRSLRVAASSNLALNQTANKLRLLVPSALRAPAAGYLARFGIMEATVKAPKNIWMDWELATLQPDCLALFWGFFRTPAEQRDHTVLQSSLSRCEKHYRKLDAHLAYQPYLVGATFTMADIPCATSLYRYFEMGVAAGTLADLSEAREASNVARYPF